MFDLEKPVVDEEYGGIFLASTDLSHTNSLRHARDEDIELMQFTGLKDKNEKDIYEGDIVSDDDIERIIKWGWHQDADSYYEYGVGFNINPDLAKRFVVLGNIYENPELLKSA